MRAARAAGLQRLAGLTSSAHPCLRLLQGGEDTVYCSTSCGNSFHSACFRRWREHARQRAEAVTCPLCRGAWAEPGEPGAAVLWQRQCRQQCHGSGRVLPRGDEWGILVLPLQATAAAAAQTRLTARSSNRRQRMSTWPAPAAHMHGPTSACRWVGGVAWDVGRSFPRLPTRRRPWCCPPPAAGAVRRHQPAHPHAPAASGGARPLMSGPAGWRQASHSA